MSAPVLAVLEATSAGLHSVAANCSPRSELSNPMRERAEALDEARAAVAELIEADKEFDAAIAAHAATHAGTPHDEFAASVERKRAAIKRRAAALARCGGAA